jgi:hypothetical protein
MITEAIKLAIGENNPNLKTALEILAKEKGQTPQGPVSNKPFFQPGPGFPTIKNMFNPLGIPAFNLNQPLTSPFKTQPFDPIAKKTLMPEIKPFEMPKKPATPEPVDIKKILDLTKPAEAFNVLNQSVMPNVTTFTNLTPPTTETGQAFGNLLDPANRLPTSFGRINNSAGSVADSLLTLSNSIASWRPPNAAGVGGVTIGVDGQPVPGAATGAHVLGSGLLVIHSDEEVVPARVRAFRDTLGQNLTQSLVSIKKFSAGDTNSISRLTTITGNDRTNNFTGPKATGLFPKLSTLNPVNDVAGGNLAAPRAVRGGQQPVSVTVQQGDVTINIENAASQQEIARLERMLEQHRAETGKIALQTVERAMQNGRVRS